MKVPMNSEQEASSAEGAEQLPLKVMDTEAFESILPTVGPVPSLRDKLGPIDLELAKDLEFVDCYELFGANGKTISFSAHLYWKSQKMDLRGFVITATNKQKRITKITEPMCLVWSKDHGHAVWVPAFSHMDPKFMDTVRHIIIDNCEDFVREFRPYGGLARSCHDLLKSRYMRNVKLKTVDVEQVYRPYQKKKRFPSKKQDGNKQGYDPSKKARTAPRGPQKATYGSPQKLSSPPPGVRPTYKKY